MKGIVSKISHFIEVSCAMIPADPDREKCGFKFKNFRYRRQRSLLDCCIVSIVGNLLQNILKLKGRGGVCAVVSPMDPTL